MVASLIDNYSHNSYLRPSLSGRGDQPYDPYWHVGVTNLWPLLSGYNFCKRVITKSGKYWCVDFIECLLPISRSQSSEVCGTLIYREIRKRANPLKIELNWIEYDEGAPTGLLTKCTNSHHSVQTWIFWPNLWGGGGGGGRARGHQFSEHVLYGDSNSHQIACVVASYTHYYRNVVFYSVDRPNVFLHNARSLPYLATMINNSC